MRRRKSGKTCFFVRTKKRKTLLLRKDAKAKSRGILRCRAFGPPRKIRRFFVRTKKRRAAACGRGKKEEEEPAGAVSESASGSQSQSLSRSLSESTRSRRTSDIRTTTFHPHAHPDATIPRSGQKKRDRERHEKGKTRKARKRDALPLLESARAPGRNHHTFRTEEEGPRKTRKGEDAKGAKKGRFTTTRICTRTRTQPSHVPDRRRGTAKDTKRGRRERREKGTLYHYSNLHAHPDATIPRSGQKKRDRERHEKGKTRKARKRDALPLLESARAPGRNHPTFRTEEEGPRKTRKGEDAKGAKKGRFTTTRLCTLHSIFPTISFAFFASSPFRVFRGISCRVLLHAYTPTSHVSPRLTCHAPRTTVHGPRERERERERFTVPRSTSRNRAVRVRVRVRVQVVVRVLEARRRSGITLESTPVPQASSLKPHASSLFDSDCDSDCDPDTDTDADPDVGARQLSTLKSQAFPL